MYQLDANNFIMIFFLINGLYMFPTFSCPSSGVLIYRLLHCRMWCYAIGVEAVVLRICCVVLCTVCQLVSNCKYPKYVEAIYEKKITIKLFASSWYIFLTCIYDARSHLHHNKNQFQRDQTGCRYALLYGEETCKNSFSTEVFQTA